MIRLYPSLISADLLNLAATIATFDPICAGYHLDVMDDHFVPNLTWGPAFINAISKATTKPLWVHLMVDTPSTWPARLELPAGSIITIHAESPEPIEPLLAVIKKRGWRAGIALNPATSVNTIIDLLALVDHVTIMSVVPGFSGQSFKPEVLDKLAPLIAYRSKNNLTFAIGMDGGINRENIRTVADAGVDDCAVAAAIFHQPDPLSAYTSLLALTTL